jgi:succinate dehydrogenase (ubiquinone) cytochrome b560 subunit
MPFNKILIFTCFSNTNIISDNRGYSSVPEYWGRDSPYHGGTDFLGTPKNHLDLVAKRPLSPHVFEIDHKQMHYKMPLAATSSILNRVTGVMLSVGFGGVGLVSLKHGDVGGLIASYKAAYPLLVFPAKFAVAFPLAYHYLAAIRHMYWDRYKYGNMIDKNSPLELPNIQASSKAVILGGAALAAGLAVYSI